MGEFGKGLLVIGVWAVVLMMGDFGQGREQGRLYIEESRHVRSICPAIRFWKEGQAVSCFRTQNRRWETPQMAPGSTQNPGLAWSLPGSFQIVYKVSHRPAGSAAAEALYSQTLFVEMVRARPHRPRGLTGETVWSQPIGGQRFLVRRCQPGLPLSVCAWHLPGGPGAVCIVVGAMVTDNGSYRLDDLQADIDELKKAHPWFRGNFLMADDNGFAGSGYSTSLLQFIMVWSALERSLHVW